MHLDNCKNVQQSQQHGYVDNVLMVYRLINMNRHDKIFLLLFLFFCIGQVSYETLFLLSVLEFSTSVRVTCLLSHMMLSVYNSIMH